MKSVLICTSDMSFEPLPRLGDPLGSLIPSRRGIPTIPLPGSDTSESIFQVDDIWVDS